MNHMRRKIFQSFGAWVSVSGLSACAQPAAPRIQRAYTEEEQRRMHRFRGVNGYELYVSGFGRNSEEGVFARIKNAVGNPMDSGHFWTGGDSKSTGSLGTPEFLKSVQVEVAERLGGKELYKRTIPVADRIPDDLLDDIRLRGGGLRIKIRLHREGVLLGWDIERIPNPMRWTREEISKQRIFLPYAYSHTGGDFKEARSADYVWDGSGFKGLPKEIPAHHPEIHLMRPWRFENLVRLPSAERLGGVVPKAWAEQGLFITSAKDVGGENRVKGALYEKGWYIHPKTGERIETDF